jgi:hypothetical protein
VIVIDVPHAPLAAGFLSATDGALALLGFKQRKEDLLCDTVPPVASTVELLLIVSSLVPCPVLFGMLSPPDVLRAR